MAPKDLPVGIDRARHYNLAGRNHHVWWRRGSLVLIAALPVLGLLSVFGQHASSATYRNSAVTLVVNSPPHVRGGLIFTTEIVITPNSELGDARLYLDDGWFQAMTLNGVSPQPSSETSEGHWQVWNLGKIHLGTPFHLWISWQTNPTNAGRHSQTLALYDGGTRLMTVHRTLTVFP